MHPDVESVVGPSDLERLAVAAHLIGEAEVSLDLLVHAHHEWVRSSHLTADSDLRRPVAGLR